MLFQNHSLITNLKYRILADIHFTVNLTEVCWTKV
jgi:hypothetical protein